jgi:hypothetical protein
MERARRALALEMVQLMNLVLLVSLLFLNVFPLVQAQVTGNYKIPTNFSLRSVFVMIPVAWVNFFANMVGAAKPF